MINDSVLSTYLSNTKTITLQTIPLTIGDTGEHMMSWQRNFNQMSIDEMYAEYKHVVTQLIHHTMDEKLRLTLMQQVFKIASRLFVSLKQIYQNQTGFLDVYQQQSLDALLSAYYLTIMFYHSIWQRVANEPVVVQKKGLSALLGRQVEDISESLIQDCVYGMMSLLREALYEKYFGYRQDIGVIWQYLNACFLFVNNQGWQNYQSKDANLFTGKAVPTLQQIYYQCLLAHIINPYASRRPDLLEVQEKSLTWIDSLQITDTEAERPFLFVNLLGNEPPQLLHAGLSFNPFAKGNQCLFINLQRFQKNLEQVINIEKNSNEVASKLAVRHAKIVLQNINTTLEVPPSYHKTQGNCQIVVGFAHIHYMLANKSSLNNLIHAQTLPDRLRPRHQTQQQLNKSTTVQLVGTTNKQRHLAHNFSYPPFETTPHSQISRSPTYSTIGQFQVQSLIAIRQTDSADKSWQLGRVSHIQQTPKSNVSAANVSQNHELIIESWVELFGTHAIPCGVRLQNSGTRPPYFVPALIVPKNIELGHRQTTIMMARFGYQVGDKLIIRIETKEVTISLTELVTMTDDIEEYIFLRLQ